MKSSNLLPLRGAFRSFTTPVLGIALALAASVAGAATVYDVEDDFSASNPSGPWSYGEYGVAGPVPDTTAFTAFSNYAPNFLGTPIDGWNPGAIDPNVSHNDSGAIYSNFGVTWDVNAVNVSPANATYAGVRFTAPDTKVYSLTSSFENVQSNSAKDVYVYKNNVQVDTFLLGGTAHSYNRPILPLVAGDVVDFIVSGSNNVALDATFAQSTWSLADDFSLASNPNGPWAYGTASANAGLPNTSTFAAFGTSEVTNIGGVLSNTLEYWHNGPSNNVDPGISHNQHGTQVTCCGTIIWEPNQVNFSPFGADYVDATWTAPATGLYTVDANFFNAQVATPANVFVYLNGTQLFAGTTGAVLDYSIPNGATYESAVLSLTAGDVIHFLADGGSNIAVSALINPIPEPAALSLAMLGVVGLVGARRRAALRN